MENHQDGVSHVQTKDETVVDGVLERIVKHGRDSDHGTLDMGMSLWGVVEYG